LAQALLYNLQKKATYMTSEEIKELDTQVRKARFVLSQKAGALHDLIEDRLPADYRDIPAYAEDAFLACKAWDELNTKLLANKI
jgi:hypothetical protein